MKSTNPTAIKVNGIDVNVMYVDTGAYPDAGIADILSYNHLDNPSSQGTTLKAGLAGRVGLLTCGLPAIPVILYGNKYPTTNSLVLYKMTVLTKERDFSASITAGTVTPTADGLAVQLPATAGDVTLTINNYMFRITVQEPTAINPYIADHILVGTGIVPNVATGGFGNAVVVSKDGNWLITGIQGFDTDGVTPLNYLAVFTKVQNGNKYSWQLHATLAPASADTGDAFAVWAFDISADGSQIVVGAWNSNVTTGLYTPQNPAVHAGDITVYKRTSNTWDSGHRYTRTGALPTTNPNFGYSVALSDDGSRIVVGQPHIENQSTTTNVASSSWIIYFDAATNDFVLHRKMQNNASERIGSKYGMGVAISGDGSKVFSSNFFYNAGVAVARIEEFDWNGTSFPSSPTRTFTCDVTGQSAPENFVNYGDRSIVLSDDGNKIAVGFSWAGVNGQESAGLVQVLENQSGTLTKIAELQSPSGIQTANLFGWGLEMTDDANYLFVGAGESYGNIPAESGSVHVFKWDATNSVYNAIERIRSENDYPLGDFGWSISYDRVSKYLAISQQADNASANQGSIHYIPVGTLVV